MSSTKGSLNNLLDLPKWDELERYIDEMYRGSQTYQFYLKSGSSTEINLLPILMFRLDYKGYVPYYMENSPPGIETIELTKEDILSIFHNRMDEIKNLFISKIFDCCSEERMLEYKYALDWKVRVKNLKRKVERIQDMNVLFKIFKDNLIVDLYDKGPRAMLKQVELIESHLLIGKGLT
jgi:hypothetical protein